MSDPEIIDIAAGRSVAIRAVVLPDGRLLVAVGAVIEAAATDILFDIPADMKVEWEVRRAAPKRSRRALRRCH